MSLWRRGKSDKQKARQKMKSVVSIQIINRRSIRLSLSILNVRVL